MTAAAIPFRKEMSFAYGVAAEVTPLIRRVVARNPGPFTYHGTNSYVVGRGEVAIIDPGPALDEHVAALTEAVRGETVTHIVVTHTHLDHCAAVAALNACVGGRVVGAHPKELPQDERPTESIDYGFAPDIVLDGKTRISGPGWTLAPVFTPGHMSNHYCFALAEERVLFSGDHVMGWNTTIVAPPDGDMRDYFTSLETCLARDDVTYWPGHGPEIPKPLPFVRAYLMHRRMRESEIAACLGDGLATIAAMVGRMYSHLPQTMHRAASRAILAHLVHMVETGRAACDGQPGPESRYRPA